VTRQGKREVFLSNPTYVDPVRNGHTLKSTSHTDLKTCPGRRKSVSFDVLPGRSLSS
jgi:hypothetical protein